jgi:hypothetical protein
LNNLNLEDIEFIKILAHSDSIILEKTMNGPTRTRLESQIGTILREYYRENTMGHDKVWTRTFESVGITEDEGKAAIACARRLGLNIF